MILSRALNIVGSKNVSNIYWLYYIIFVGSLQSTSVVFLEKQSELHVYDENCVT